MNWNDYTTKTALKDNDELMILDKDANANKRTLMDKIWDYVVDKMTTAVIAKLGTTNKTLIGAVNELNSKSFIHVYPTVSFENQKVSMHIPSGIDENGVALIYFCINIENAVNISALINHATKWDSKIVQINVTNANPGTSTWSGSAMTLTVPMLQNVTQVYGSDCYILKLH